MTETAVLSKVLNIREHEKMQAQKVYQGAVGEFEKVATQLYELLRKKEMAESSYETNLQQSAPIDNIREMGVYINYLTEQIMNLQHEYQRARNDMDTKHGHLSDAYVEVKKFEKIIEHRLDEISAIEKKQDNDMMDEISNRQYMSQLNR